MSSALSPERLRFLLNRLSDRLWVKPLAVCLVSIGAVFLAKLADGTGLAEHVPVISPEASETLLSVMAASMLVIATFSVASMVAAYASASSTATPRAVTLVVADDASQNALSTFVGAFIFSLVALTMVKDEFFGRAALFILFALTISVFAVVIVTFVRWVDGIARLGRLDSTVDKVEQATAACLERQRKAPTLGGVPVGSHARGRAVFAARVGYVQHVNIAAVQAWAEKANARVVVAALPGTFAAPGRPLAYIIDAGSQQPHAEPEQLIRAFEVGDKRLFDDDPRFGLIVLSEIGGRALSPGINDPGTAIDIIGTLVRLLTDWGAAPAHDATAQGASADNAPEVRYDRVEVPRIAARDMFDDAFTAIGRDGAGAVEVAVRLQKALRALGSLGDEEMRAAADHHSRLALQRSRLAMKLPEDVDAVEAAARSTDRTLADIPTR